MNIELYNEIWEKYGEWLEETPTHNLPAAFITILGNLLIRERADKEFYKNNYEALLREISDL